MKYPIVYVIWKDIWKDHAEANTGAWADADKLSGNKLCTAVTVGFLVHEDDEAIQVATTYIDEYDIVGRPDIITKALIVYKTELDVKEYNPPTRRSKPMKKEK